MKTYIQETWNNDLTVEIKVVQSERELPAEDEWKDFIQYNEETELKEEELNFEIELRKNLIEVLKKE